MTGGVQEELAYYEAVPFLLVVEAVERDGAWLHRACHPELPDCSVETFNVVDAIDRLDELRLSVIRERYRQGMAIPVVREPLRLGNVRADI